MTDDVLLSVEHLSTVFEGGERPLVAVDDVSFHVRRGETLGLVGESGSGKSMTAYSIMRLLPSSARIVNGSVLFRGADLVSAADEHLQRVRGAGIGFIFQEPAAALNPVMSIGDHIVEALTTHGLAAKREARERAVALLRAVRIPDAETRVNDYPHQLSGGMRQRAMIAVALACAPSLVIADEPTTALDVTIQAQVLDLLRDMKQQFDLALLLITHDLAVIAQTADRVAVMYTGRIVEEGAVSDTFARPLHPYTRGLLASIPSGTAGARLRAIDGTVPSPADLPPGCTFAPRCPQRMETCTKAVPALTMVGGQQVRCYLHSEASEARSGPLVLSAAAKH